MAKVKNSFEPYKFIMVHIGKKLLNNIFSGDKRRVESKKKGSFLLVGNCLFKKSGDCPSVLSDNCLICYLMIFITSSMLRLNGPLCSSLMVHMAAANFPASTGLAPCRRL